MKKIIAHSVYPYLFLTGSWIYSQLTGIDAFESIVITDEKKNMEVFPFDKVFSINELTGMKKYGLKAYHKLFDTYTPFVSSALKKNRVSLVHSHFGNVGWQDIAAVRKAGIPHITTFYGYDVSQLPLEAQWKKRFGELFEACDRFTAEGSYMKQALVDLGCREEKVMLQHLGIDLDKVEFIPRQIGEDGLVRILVAGTFREKKGIPYAVEAFGRASQKHKNMRLTIIGDVNANIPKEVQIKTRIMEIIQQYGIADKVDMKGFLPYSDMLELAKSHHIFLSPSVQAADGDNEGGAPVTIIEMSAAGMPVVSTFHCDIPEVLIDGQGGYLVKERDVDALVERLCYLVENENTWPVLGQNGRKHVEENYNIKIQVQRQCDIYRSLLEE